MSVTHPTKGESVTVKIGALMNSTQNDYVRELMATPRRQAERLRALVDRPHPS